MRWQSRKVPRIVRVCVCVCSYGVAFLYGAKLVREENYSAGEVMNVIFAAIIGGFSLGQAGPNFGTFATGRTAGYRVFNVIDRKPLIDVADTGVVPKAPMQVCVYRLDRPRPRLLWWWFPLVCLFDKLVACAKWVNCLDPYGHCTQVAR